MYHPLSPPYCLKMLPYCRFWALPFVSFGEALPQLVLLAGSSIGSALTINALGEYMCYDSTMDRICILRVALASYVMGPWCRPYCCYLHDSGDSDIHISLLLAPGVLTLLHGSFYSLHGPADMEMDLSRVDGSVLFFFSLSSGANLLAIFHFSPECSSHPHTSTNATIHKQLFFASYTRHVLD
jgi:hypothetical protein